MNQELKKHKHIVFGGEHYNPLGIVRSLGENGIKSIGIIISSDRPITSKSKYLVRKYFVKDIEEGYILLNTLFGQEELKPFVYASDDQITSYMDARYDEIKDKFYFYNAGAAGRIGTYMDKYTICMLAEKHGIPIARTWIVDKGQIPDDICYPIVTKAIISTLNNWKKDSIICNNENELNDAYKMIRSPKVLLQQYIQKKNELCLDGYVGPNGSNTVVTISSKYKYLIPNSYSYYMTVESYHDKEISFKLSEMFREIGFTGIFSAEFLVGKENELYFLEINFRNSTWSYASTCAGMSLPVLWADSILTGNSNCDQICEITKPFTAIVEFDDFRYRVKEKKMSFLKWMIEFLKCKCKFYFAVGDIKPFFSVILSKVRKMIA